MKTTTFINNSDHPIIQSHNNLDVENQHTQEITEMRFDSKRSQWLRADLLGTNDALLSTASLMMVVGAVCEDVKTMLFTGIVGLVAGACSMAIREFVSVYSHYDIEILQTKGEIKNGLKNYDELQDKKIRLSAFAVGASVPLLVTAFIIRYDVRLVVVVGVVSMTLIGFGGLSAVKERAPSMKLILRIQVGGWVAMGVTFGLTKAVGSTSTGFINT